MDPFNKLIYRWRQMDKCKGKKNSASKIIMLVAIVFVLFLASGFFPASSAVAEAGFEVYDDFARSDFTRISVTADLHLETEPNRTRMVQCLKAMEAAQDPQVIIFCGDLYTGSTYTSPAPGAYEYGSGFSNVYDEVKAAVSLYNGNAVPVFIAGNHDMDIPGDYYSHSGYTSYFGVLQTLNFDIFLFGASQQSTYVGLYTDNQINALNTYLATRPDKSKPVIVAGHFPIDQDQTWNATNSDLVRTTMGAYNQPITFLWAHRHAVNPPPYYIEYGNYTIANAGAVSYGDPSYARELNLTFNRLNDELDYEWLIVLTSDGSKARSAYLHQILPAFTPKLYLTYAAGTYGTIAGEVNQNINYSSDGTAVTAVPDVGYHFVSWSDGSTANPRTESNVTADLNVTANFAVDRFTLNYNAGPGGAISGETSQTVSYGGDGTLVSAVADSGYHFVRWSDGSIANPRTDAYVTATISVTAIFEPDIKKVTSVNLNYDNLTLLVGEKAKLVANIDPSDATNQLVSWKSSNSKIARVDANGLVTANKAGYAEIKVITADGGYQDSCVINVVTSLPPTFITLTYISGDHGKIDGLGVQTVKYGGNGSMVTAVANTGYHFVGWSDGNTANPRTDSNVTSNITVTAIFEIDSSIIPVKGVILEPTQITLRVGEQFGLNAKIDPWDASNQAITWKSSNLHVAAVDTAGIVIAKKSGSALITVTTIDGNYKATCSITVIK